MTTTTEERDLSQFKDKRVVVTRNLPEPNDKGESAVEVEGLVQVGSALGLVIKPKGQTKFDLIPAEEIEEIHLAKDSSKPLKASKIKLVELGQARRHLLERHGYTLEWVNSVDEETAKQHHDEIDHEAEGLGHVHSAKGDKDEKKDESDGSDS